MGEALQRLNASAIPGRAGSPPPRLAGAVTAAATPAATSTSVLPTPNSGPARDAAPVRHAGAVRLRLLTVLLLGVLFAAPMAAAILAVVLQGLQVWAGSGMTQALQEPQLPRALAVGVAAAAGSTLLAVLGTGALVARLHGTPAWQRLQALLAPALAVPHAAFAIGFALWLMPAGWLARLIAPLAGWGAPPAWASVHDGWGLGLMAVLALKELPFLLWCLAALLARPEVAGELRTTLLLARSLGYGRVRAWSLLVAPRWGARLAWPLAAVWAYGLSVVDVALVIGPTHPPTLAVLAWQALSDPDAQRRAEGVAMVWLLAAVLVAGLVLAAVLWRGYVAWQRRRAMRGERGAVERTVEAGRAWQGLGAGGIAGVGPSGRGRRRFDPRDALGMFGRSHAVGSVAAIGLGVVYAAVLLALLLASFTRLWPFPDLWPQAFGLDAWQQVRAAGGTVIDTIVLALVSSTAACALALLWLEATPPAWDARVAPFVLAPLLVPPLLWLVGLHRLALELRLDGSALGLAWVHFLAVLPYSVITLAGAWRSFDPRWQAVAATLGRSRAAFWWQVKLPMLRAPLAAAWAVGFAVSVAQYLPTQVIGAGRHATVTTEAVTLAAGGQRMPAAALALLQAVLPLLAFALAHRLGAGRAASSYAARTGATA